MTSPTPYDRCIVRGCEQPAAFIRLTAGATTVPYCTRHYEIAVFFFDVKGVRDTRDEQVQS